MSLTKMALVGALGRCSNMHDAQRLAERLGDDVVSVIPQGLTETAWVRSVIGRAPESTLASWAVTHCGDQDLLMSTARGKRRHLAKAAVQATWLSETNRDVLYDEFEARGDTAGLAWFDEDSPGRVGRLRTEMRQTRERLFAGGSWDEKVAIRQLMVWAEPEDFDRLYTKGIADWRTDVVLATLHGIFSARHSLDYVQRGLGEAWVRDGMPAPVEIFSRLKPLRQTFVGRELIHEMLDGPQRPLDADIVEILVRVKALDNIRLHESKHLTVLSSEALDVVIDAGVATELVVRHRLSPSQFARACMRRDYMFADLETYARTRLGALARGCTSRRGVETWLAAIDRWRQAADVEVSDEDMIALGRFITSDDDPLITEILERADVRGVLMYTTGHWYAPQLGRAVDVDVAHLDKLEPFGWPITISELAESTTSLAVRQAFLDRVPGMALAALAWSGDHDSSGCASTRWGEIALEMAGYVVERLEATGKDLITGLTTLAERADQSLSNVCEVLERL